MTTQPSITYPPTLIFNSVDAFLETVQARSIAELGCATLKRATSFAAGMGERRIAFVLLTARDHARDEILSCSVYLHYGDYMAQDQLFTPRDEWERAQARGAQVRRQLLARLQRLSEVHLLDATYHVHPDVHLRFAAFIPDDPPADQGS